MKKDFFLRNKWMLTGVLLVGILFCLAVPKWMIPEMLRESRNDDGKAIRFEVNDAKAVIFYPIDTEKEFVKVMTKYIQNDLKTKAMSTDKIKVDYHKYELETLLFLCFDVVNEQGELIGAYSGICDMSTHTEVELSEIVQDDFYHFVSSELRYQTKESGQLGDLAYTNEFYEKTSPYQVHDVQIYVEDEQVLLYFNTQLNDESVLLHATVSKEMIAPYFVAGHVLYATASVTHPIRHYVDSSRPMVAITFDDGPLRKNTLLAMELLGAIDGRSTFFMLGTRMNKNPDVVLDLINQGHEVGSHTYDHADLTKKKTNLSVQYNRNQEILTEITGGESEIRLLRPPYGAMNQKVKDTSPYPLVLWSLDTEDWKKKDAQLIHEYIMEHVQDGDIILLHDLHDFSVESLRTLLPALVDAGYQVVTVSEMMEARGIEMKNGVSYSKARR